MFTDLQVHIAVPYQYWLGRLLSRLDRYRFESLLSSETSASDTYDTAEVRRLRSAMKDLEACCKTDEALDSLRSFRQKLLDMERRQYTNNMRVPKEKEKSSNGTTAPIGSSHTRKPSFPKSMFPSMLSGPMVFPTLARPNPVGAPLPRSKTMESIKSVAGGLRKTTMFSNDSTDNSVLLNDEEIGSGEQEDNESRGRSRLPSLRKTSDPSTIVAERKSSMRKSSADMFKKMVTDGAAKVRKLRRSLTGGNSSLEDLTQENEETRW